MRQPCLEPIRHIEQGSTEINKLPREEEEDPRHGGVTRCACAEDGFTRRRVFVVAVGAEVATVEAEHDDGEGADCAAGHEGAVDDHVEEELGGEDAIFELPDAKVSTGMHILRERCRVRDLHSEGAG